MFYAWRLHSWLNCTIFGVIGISEKNVHQIYTRNLEPNKKLTPSHRFDPNTSNFAIIQLASVSDRPLGVKLKIFTWIIFNWPWKKLFVWTNVKNNYSVNRGQPAPTQRANFYNDMPVAEKQAKSLGGKTDQDTKKMLKYLLIGLGGCAGVIVAFLLYRVCIFWLYRISGVKFQGYNFRGQV